MLCIHGGNAQPTTVTPNVLVSGMAVVTMASPYLIAGCALATIPSPPCVTGQWISAATHVQASGQPVILMDSQGLCPPGKMQVVSAQTRVSAI